MIPDLEHKANNEKYFKSIRYFSHSLKGEKRRNFIAQVAEHNIYLAAQCIMSAEKDEELENRLIEKSQSIAQNFADPENSAKGFLALAEFESLKTIISLFSNIEKPNNTHLQVIAKIFENKQPDIFCSFLLIFIQINKTILIQFATNTYNGELPVNNQTKPIIKQFINHLINKKLLGLLGIFIEKFKLYTDLSYILDTKTQNIINKLNGTFKGAKLGFKIAEANNLIQVFTPDNFIKSTSSKKRLKFAIQVLNKYNSKNNLKFNAVIERLLENTGKKSRGKLKSIGKNTLLDYLSENPELKNKVLVFFETNIKQIELKQKEETEKKEQQITFLHKIVENIDFSLDDRIHLYFSKNSRANFELFLVELLSNFETNLIELSHKLRIFELQGSIKHIMDYGCYVKPQTFRTEKLLFLHKNQITDKQEVNHPNEVLKEGDLITFRIIGINQQNHRLNISCLDIFKPEDNAVPTGE